MAYHLVARGGPTIEYGSGWPYARIGNELGSRHINLWYIRAKKVLTRARTERRVENLYIKHDKVYYIYMQYKLIHTKHRSIVDSP